MNSPLTVLAKCCTEYKKGVGNLFGAKISIKLGILKIEAQVKKYIKSEYSNVWNCSETKETIPWTALIPKYQSDIFTGMEK